MTTRALCAALLVALAAVGRAAPDEKPATRHVESEDKTVAIDVPAEWETSLAQAPQSILRVKANVPHADAPIDVTVYRVPGIRGERGQAYEERRNQAATLKCAPGEVRLDPAPHLVMDLPGGQRRVWTFRILARTGYSVTINSTPASWEVVKDGVFRAVASLTVKGDEWPARPEGFRVLSRDGYEFLLHPSIKDKEIEYLRVAVLEQEKRYAKTHGPVPKPEGDPIQIVVVPDAAAALKVSQYAVLEQGCACVEMEGRLFAVPLRQNPDGPVRGELAYKLALLFHGQCYGGGVPSWESQGDARVASIEAWSGKPLPAAPVNAATLFAASPRRFDELAKNWPKDGVADAACYVALFRAGGKEWQTAYAAYLKDVAESGDWETAEKTRLLSLDQDKLRAAAEAFVKSLKPAKGR